jgi:polyhydroxyalkanoate synthesis regulator phasin
MANTMEELFKNFLYTGVGLVAMTAEKIQKSVDKLVSEGKLTMDEGKKLVDKLVKEGKLSTEEGKKILENLMKKGKISSEEGKKMLDDFLKNAKSKKDELETQMRGIVERVISSFNFATEKEVHDLKKRVAILEAKLKAANKPAVPLAKKPVAPKPVKPETV